MLDMEDTLVPLMLRFKRPAAGWDTDFTYDEEARLNVSLHEGRLQPTVSLPNSPANMKSTMKKKQGGED